MILGIVQYNKKLIAVSKGLIKSPSCFDIFFAKVKATGRFCQILVSYIENLNKTLLNYLNTLKLSSWGDTLNHHKIYIQHACYPSIHSSKSVRSVENIGNGKRENSNRVANIKTIILFLSILIGRGASAIVLVMGCLYHPSKLTLIMDGPQNYQV